MWSNRVRNCCRLSAAALVASCCERCLTRMPPGWAAETVTYLFPAPPSLPAFGPIRLAQGKGYFAEAGLDVKFAVGRGGVDVAKQVGAGNAPLGGIVADGPIMVRQNGVPIKIVAVFGGRGFMQLVVREDSGIEKPADLKGKTISVMSFQDTTFYALLGLLASVGLTAGRPQHPVGRAERGMGVRRDRQVCRDGRGAGLDPAGAGRRCEGEGHPQRRILSAHGTSHWRIRPGHNGKTRARRPLRPCGAARHEGHHGRPEQGRRRFRRISFRNGRARKARSIGAELLRHVGLSRPDAARRGQR